VSSDDAPHSAGSTRTCRPMLLALPAVGSALDAGSRPSPTVRRRCHASLTGVPVMNLHLILITHAGVGCYVLAPRCNPNPTINTDACDR